MGETTRQRIIRLYENFDTALKQIQKKYTYINYVEENKIRVIMRIGEIYSTKISPMTLLAYANCFTELRINNVADKVKRMNDITLGHKYLKNKEVYRYYFIDQKARTNATNLLEDILTKSSRK